jgi:hypothetical protein
MHNNATVLFRVPRRVNIRNCRRLPHSVPQQSSSKLGRCIVTQIATTQTNATQFTTPFGSQTRQVRIASMLALWITIDSTAVVTANSASALIPANNPEYFAVTPGQVLNFISTSTGYVSLTEMT